jgi:hypothetical protein
MLINFYKFDQVKKQRKKTTRNTPCGHQILITSIILSHYAYEVSCRIRAMEVALPFKKDSPLLLGSPASN